jgi:hypothetical protein
MATGQEPEEGTIDWLLKPDCGGIVRVEEYLYDVNYDLVGWTEREVNCSDCPMEI